VGGGGVTLVSVVGGGGATFALHGVFVCVHHSRGLGLEESAKN